MNFQKIGWVGEMDKNCCTILATGICLDIRFSDAKIKLESLGRLPDYGCNFQRLAPELGLVCRPDLITRTVSRTVPRLINGRYIVMVYGHVFAVIDGTIYDWKKPTGNQKVEMVYERQL